MWERNIRRKRKDMRACKCDFLNKITFQPGLNNTLDLHTCLYTAKSIHYHPRHPSKALEKRAGMGGLILTMRKKPTQGLVVNWSALGQNPGLLSHGSGSLPHTILPPTPHYWRWWQALQCRWSSSLVFSILLNLLEYTDRVLQESFCLTDEEFDQKKQKAQI